MLAQLTKLDRDGIKATTKGIIGLASVMGPDEGGLEGATRMVVRALEGNMQGLRRVGIAIDETLPKGQQLIELQRRLAELYPRATAELETMGGKVKQVGKEWHEFWEKFGAGMVEVSHAPAILGATNDAIGWLRENIGAGALDEDFRKATDSAKEFQLGLVVMRPTMKELGDEMGRGEAHWLAYTKRISELDAWLISIRPQAEAVVAIFSKFLHGADPAAKIGLLAKKAFDATKPINLLEKNVEDLAAAFAGLDTSIDWENFFPPEKEFVNPLQDLIDAVPKTNLAVNEMANVWNSAMQAMTAGIVSFGDANASVLANVGAIFANFTKSAIAGLETMVLKEMWASKMGVAADQAEAQSGAVKWIMKIIPWPLSLVAVAGSLALVNALFAKILKFERGFEGVISKPTPILVGETGPEYVSVTPMSKARSSRGAMPAYAGAPAMAMAGPSVNVYFNAPLISTVRLSDADISAAGAKIKNEVLRQMHRLG